MVQTHAVLSVYQEIGQTLVKKSWCLSSVWQLGPQVQAPTSRSSDRVWDCERIKAMSFRFLDEWYLDTENTR